MVLTGNTPPNSVVQQVQDFLYGYLNYPNVEIEARFGQIIDKATNQRLSLPIITEAVLTDIDAHIRFESNMSIDLHKQLNQFLNHRVVTTPKESRSPPVTYKHTKEVDEFYSNGSERVRVTKDAATGKTLRTIIKKKYENLHIFVPYSQFDVRISIATEEQVQFDVQSQPLSIRHKDRLTYTQGWIQLDLTQVKVPSEQPLHELELEVADVSFMVKERALLASGQENKYHLVVKEFVDNIRGVVSHVLL